MEQNEKKVGVMIPKEKLSDFALNGLIEEFILREGTDYGVNEQSLEQKKNQILNQLNKNHIIIFFDPEIESTTLMRKEEVKKLNLQNWDVLS
jgi:uncharacterized protein